MAKHVTYRGATIDMGALSREHEKTIAVGNMGVNARGDKVVGSTVTQTADEMARQRHRIQSTIVHTSLKGDQPDGSVLDTTKQVAQEQKPQQTANVDKDKLVDKNKKNKNKEIELSNGDIIVDDGDKDGK